MDLVINGRLKKLLPSLTDEEKEKLEANIVADGQVLDPILTWEHDGKQIVIDGMHRYAIASKKSLPYTTKPMQFANIEQVEVWMLDHALGRRHLMKPNEVRKIRGELYNKLKGKSGGENGSKGTGVPSDHFDTTVSPSGGGSAAKIVAEKTGVSEPTVKRDGKFVEAYQQLASPMQKIVDEGKVNITDEQVRALAVAEPTKQVEVARAVRTGKARSVREAMEEAGVKATPPKKTCEHKWVSDGNGQRYCEHCKKKNAEDKKPPKRGKAGDEFKKVDDLFGKLFRAIDDIAASRGKKKGKFHKQCEAAMDSLHDAIKAWKGAEPEST
jgi:hypothetical protein